MGQVCRCCSHERRDELDRAILSGAPNAEIARRFGVSDDSVGYHIRYHLAKQVQEVTMWNLEQLAGKLQSFEEDWDWARTTGRERGSVRDVLAAVETAGRQIERLAKMTVEAEQEQRIQRLEEALREHHDPPQQT